MGDRSGRSTNRSSPGPFSRSGSIRARAPATCGRACSAGAADRAAVRPRVMTTLPTAGSSPTAHSACRWRWRRCRSTCICRSSTGAISACRSRSSAPSCCSRGLPTRSAIRCSGGSPTAGPGAISSWRLRCRCSRSEWWRCSTRPTARLRRGSLRGLAVTYLGFSMASIAYQAWGAQLVRRRTRAHPHHGGARAVHAGGRRRRGGAPVGARRRERAGLARLSWIFAGLLALCGAVTLAFAPRPRRAARAASGFAGGACRAAGKPRLPASARGLHALGHRCRGALDAGAVLRRRRPPAAHLTGLFLVLYFLAGAVGIPLWVATRAADRQAPRVARRHAARGRRLRLGVHARTGRRRRIRRDLRALRDRARRRPRAAGLDPGGRDRSRPPRCRRVFGRQLLRNLEPRRPRRISQSPPGSRCRRSARSATRRATVPQAGRSRSSTACCPAY